MSALQLESASPDETIRFGRTIGSALSGGECIALIGPLGAGKTQLVKGIALGNGASERHVITSPTFTLMHQYPGRLVLYHIDVYRLKGAAELAAIGFDELIGPGRAVILEWADKVRELLPDDVLEVAFSVTGDQARRMNVQANGPISNKILSRFRLNTQQASAT